jgi:hypothetical protein
MQEPVVKALRSALDVFGIRPLHMLSGRGHHFVWSIRRASVACQALASIGRNTRSLRDRILSARGRGGDFVDEQLQSAHAGLGAVLEYVVHRVIEIAAPRVEIPLEITAVEVGRGLGGREVISIDLSEYGDPLETCFVRMPFSGYGKLEFLRSSLDPEVSARLRPLVQIPIGSDDEVSRGLAIMHSPERIEELAATSSASIPDLSTETMHLVESYRYSQLAGFHAWFHSEEPHPAERWAETYDRLDEATLSPCVRALFRADDDRLTRPAGIRHVSRLLLAQGWHPRHIAGLIASKLARRPRLQDLWKSYDPGTRADFHVRVFSAQFVCGHDDLVDFNCRSTQDRDYCPAADCRENIERHRTALLDRRRDERLGRRPFDRVLPSEAGR